MASIFKRKGKKGYWISYYERPGYRRLVWGGMKEKMAREYAVKLEEEARQKRNGMSDPRAKAYTKAEAIPLADHLEAFKSWLEGKDVTPGHVQTVTARATRLVDLSGAKQISQLTLSCVQDGLARLRAEIVHSDEDGKKNRSAQTLTHYVRAIRQFSRWLKRDGRAREDALAHLETFNAQTDRRRQRRVPTDDELRRLIEAARNGETIGQMTGPDRAVLYLTALCSGLRRSELGALLPEDFDLDTVPPAILVRAAHARNRRETRQVIPPVLADTLRPWLEGKEAGKPVFALPYWTAKMLRQDLEAANVSYEEPKGCFFDLHATRHTYITKLALSNVPVAVAQRLARHCDPKLTLGVYTHVEDAVKAAAVERLMLPGMPGGEDATGQEEPESAAPSRIALWIARTAIQASEGVNVGQDEELDTEASEVVSSSGLAYPPQGLSTPVGRDGVWWPHWSSKPVAGR